MSATHDKYREAGYVLCPRCHTQLDAAPFTLLDALVGLAILALGAILATRIFTP